MEKLPEIRMTVSEKVAEKQDLLEADEIFLTNAISGLRWVRQFENKTYGNAAIGRIWDSFFSGH